MLLCRFLAQTELSGQKPDVPSLRLRRAVQMTGQKLSTESVGNVVGKKSRPEIKRKSPKRLPSALVLSFRCPSRQDEPPQTLLSKVLGLAPDYRRKMHLFLPLARAPETHPFLLSHALALAAAVPPRFFLSGAVECPLSTGAVLYDMPVRTRLWCASHARVV